jgi:hypothetical protein
MLTRLLCLLLAFLALPALAARLYYTGTINGTLAVQMALAIDANTVTGRYFYETVGTDIPLTGTRKGNAVTMTETVDGKTTDAFTGTLSANLRTLTGTWTNPDGTKKLPMKLRAAAEIRTLTVTKPWYTLVGRYPAFLKRGAAWKTLSARLYNHVQKTLADFETTTPHDNPEIPAYTLDLTIDIADLDDDVVSLLVTSDEYTGGAHGNHFYGAWNYAMRGTAPDLLGLRDLFDSADSQAMLFPLVQADLRRQTKARGVEMWDTFAQKDLAVYTLRPTGMSFYFAPYVVAPYVAGPFRVTIPYRSVVKEINWGGPLIIYLWMGGPGTRPDVDPVTGINANDASKMSRDEFYQCYIKTTGFDKNPHEWTTREALDTYADLVKYDNNRQVASLPLAQKKLYKRIDDVLYRLAFANFTLATMTDDGTMLLDIAVSNNVDNECNMTKLIEDFRHPVSDINARQKAEADLVAAAKNVAARPATIKETVDGTDPKEYPATLRALKQAVADATALAKQLPDTSAARLAAYTLEMAKPPYDGME